jgi:hypothetical protein
LAFQALDPQVLVSAGGYPAVQKPEMRALLALGKDVGQNAGHLTLCSRCFEAVKQFKA